MSSVLAAAFLALTPLTLTAARSVEGTPVVLVQDGEARA